MTLEELAISMLNCEQTKGQTVFQHGVSVYNYFIKLTESEEEFRIPKWFAYKDLLFNNIHSKEDICLYAQFHDCGKPQVRTVDSEGKVHFPDHTNVSKSVFFEATGNELVSNLIGWDMVLHIESSIQIQNRLECEWTIKDACTLLIVSLCEIHSNASLFGGTASDSFKAKFKKIEQRGMQICKYYFENNK